jgi:hypothetical protein
VLLLLELLLRACFKSELLCAVATAAAAAATETSSNSSRTVDSLYACT